MKQKILSSESAISDYYSSRIFSSSNEKGVRELRKNIHTIISRINLIKLSLSSKDLNLPFNLDEIDVNKKIIINNEIIDTLLNTNNTNNDNISKLMMYM